MAAHAAGRHIGLLDMVVLQGPEYVESMVVGALDFRKRASSGARDTLNAELDRSVRGIPGFRDASKAPSARLKGAVLGEFAQGDVSLARALVGVWAELEAELRDAVRTQLAPDGCGDGATPSGAVPWTDSQFEEAVDAVLCGSDDFEESDVRVMLCLVSGRCVHADNSGAEVESPLFRTFLEDLEQLAPDAVEWDDFGEFLDAANGVALARHQRAAQLQLEMLESRVNTALGSYEEDLNYLGLHSQVSGWFDEAAVKAYHDVSDALPIVEDLLEMLQVYRPIRPQADSRAKEIARAPERFDAEERIMGVVTRWRELMDRPVEEDEPDFVWDDLDDGLSAAGEAQLKAEIAELRAEVERLRVADSVGQSQYDDLAKHRDGLAAERDSLQEEIGRLDGELTSRKETVEIWRLASVSARMDEAGLPASGQTEPRTVKDAVDRAEKLFPDRLVLAFNSKSDKRSQFQRPQEVFDAMAWLATEYHHRRANPGGSPDFDKLLKESCPGWSYKSSQTEITREQFEQWYTTTWEGRTYDLSPHLGKGTSHDPQNTIRIAFAWDDERRRVVVGFIGMHQRNRKS